VSKNQSIALILTEPQREALFGLLTAMTPEFRYYGGGQRNRSPAVLGLRCLKSQTGLRLLQRLFDTAPGVFQVDVLPAKRKKFAAPQTCREAERGDQIERTPFEPLQDCCDFDFCQNDNFFASRARDINVRCWIGRY